MNQTVSVIIASWNSAHTLPECINSVKAQTYPAIEIIVVDDCSTDNTESVVQTLQAEIPQLRYLRTPINAGPSAVRNYGIEAATGEWIAILDSDDWFMPERIATLIAHATETDADIVFDDLLLCHPPTTKTQKPEVIGRLIGKNATDITWSIAGYALQNRPYESGCITGFLKPLMRKSFLQEHQLRYNESLRNSEDYILILTALICGAYITYVNEAYYFYFIYGNSLSGSFNVDRHMALINAETSLLEQYRSQLDKDAISGISAHLRSLQEALVTNSMFAYIRNRQITKVIELLCAHPKMFPKNIYRVIASLYRKMTNTANRGR